MKALIFFLLLFGWHAQAAEYWVIAHEDSPFESLTRFQLRNLYLGKLDRLEGDDVFPIQTREGDALRSIFEHDLFGVRFDLKNYWLQQKLLVGAQPPLTVGDWALTMAFVSRNPGYIGYIPADAKADLKSYHLKKIAVKD